MEETKYLIKQEDYEKYKKLLQEFECKAIDIIEGLTYQFKETLAEEIDDKIKGWKKDNERLLRENWEKDDKIEQLEQELAELKEKAIVPKFKIGQEVFIVNTDYYYKKDYKVEKHKIVGIEDKIDRKNTYVRWYSLEFKDCPANYSKRYKFLEKNVFTTEQEALEKLKEVQGNE